MDSELQRIDLKLLFQVAASPDLDAVLPIFHRWRQDGEHASDWVDLADYAHMHEGPGVLIAGKRTSFSVNLNPPGPGLLTSVRSGLTGSLEDRFREAFRRARQLNAALLAEPDCPEAFQVWEGAWEVFVNDRLRFPNTAASHQRAAPALAAALGLAPETLVRHASPSGRLGYSVRTGADGPVGPPVSAPDSRC